MLNKKIVFFSVLFVFLFVFSLTVLAQEATTTGSSNTTSSEETIIDEEVAPSDLEVGEPSLLPDSPFYFLKKWQRA